MKFLVLFVFLFASTAFAQQEKNMIEMSTSSTALGAFTITDTGSSTAKSGFIGANYAYTISPRIQLAVQGNYSRFEQRQSTESYNFLVGGIFNFSDDLTDSIYASLYGGMGWTHYSGYGNYNQEALTGRAAFGKRFALKNFNLPNVTYSPEVSYTRTEYTQNSYGANSFSIRFLQFSVFF